MLKRWVTFKNINRVASSLVIRQIVPLESFRNSLRSNDNYVMKCGYRIIRRNRRSPGLSGFMPS